MPPPQQKSRESAVTAVPRLPDCFAQPGSARIPGTHPPHAKTPRPLVLLLWKRKACSRVRAGRPSVPGLQPGCFLEPRGAPHHAFLSVAVVS